VSQFGRRGIQLINNFKKCTFRIFFISPKLKFGWDKQEGADSQVHSMYGRDCSLEFSIYNKTFLLLKTIFSFSVHACL
jgi:hypothetical protein